MNEGFTPQSCNSVQTIDGVCPYNSAYGRGCKCASNLISCPAGQVGVGDSCDGKYASCKCDPNFESCVCKSEYQYTSSNCTYPRSVSGDNCSGKYTNCICPSGVSEGPYGCEEYYPAPCSSVCKIAYADNCRNRDSVSIPYGCAEEWEDCSSKCKTAYNDNCRNRTAVTCQFGCASSFADCQSKCEKCKPKTNQSCQYGCQTYWSDCSSKCQTCYSDNCRNRTAINVPTNGYCSAHYSDCSSKCSDFACYSGYYKSGMWCVKAVKCIRWGYTYESTDYIEYDDPVDNGTCTYWYDDGSSKTEWVSVRPSSDPFNSISDYCEYYCD